MKITETPPRAKVTMMDFHTKNYIKYALTNQAIERIDHVKTRKYLDFALVIKYTR